MKIQPKMHTDKVLIFRAPHKMDYFFIQLAIIFLPGLLWERVATKYALKRPPAQFETLLRTFTFGLTAYSLTFMLYGLYGMDFVIPDFKKDAGFLERRFIGQFAATIGVALVCSIAWLYAVNFKVLGRILRSIKATKSFGQEDIWDYVFSLKDRKLEYVYVRDYEAEKVYSGWIRGFSERQEVRELLLRDVQVHDLEGRLLYEVPLLYLGRPSDAIEIEFPAAERDT